MSDVIVSTTESTTDVTTTNDVTTVAITNQVVEVSQATAGLQGIPGSNSDPTYVFVTNKTGATLAKGSIVYVSGANGIHTQVSLALATGDITSARTLGWLSENIANNATGLCMVEGYLDGVNTQGITEGAQLYLSPTTPGAFTQTKPTAADHLVYVGVCAKASAGNGRVFVKVQNGYEFSELHDVSIVAVADKNLVQYDAATDLWKNVAQTSITAGSALTAGTATTISGSITKSQVSDFTSGTVTSASTAQQAGTAFFASTASTANYATTAGTSLFATNASTAVNLSGSITKSQVSDFTSGTVASASTAQQAGTASFASQAGTASFASQAGTAVYSATSGTSITISGTITNSQVSDFASGTVANISGTVTQSQVSGLGTALAAKAGLADNNTFTGLNTFNTFTTFQAGTADAIPVRIFGANGQTADLFSVNDYLTNTQFEILADGRAQSLKGIIATVSGTASIPLVVRGTAGQSANITEWTNPAGSTVIARVDKNGAVSANYFGPSATGLLGYLDWTTSSPLFQTGGTAVVGIRIRGAASQSANLQEWQASDGGTAARVTSSGSLVTTQGFAVLGGASISGSIATLLQTSNAARIPLVVQGAASQTASFFEVQNSSSATLLRVNSSGFSVSPLGFISGGTSQAGTTATSIYATAASNIGAVIRGAASQSANLLELQDSSASTVVAVTPTGTLRSAGLITAGSSSDVLGQLSVITTATSRIGAVIRGASGQTADLLQIQNSAATILTKIDQNGFTTIGTNTVLSNALLSIAPYGTTQVGAVIRGTSGQTANLQAWQNSGGTSIATVDASGNIRGNSVRTNSDYTSLLEANSGGYVRITKQTAATPNPGANLGSLYFRDGTTAGTLKLVVRAGAAGAETTILDNIPQ